MQSSRLSGKVVENLPTGLVMGPESRATVMDRLENITALGGGEPRLMQSQVGWAGEWPKRWESLHTSGLGVTLKRG